MIRVMLIIALTLPLSGCIGAQYADPLSAESANPECGTNALAALIAGRAEELSAVCRPTPVKQCAEIVKGPVVAKWKPRFDAWEACK